jgi:membrane protein YqaA with SNARE-associated domain
MIFHGLMKKILLLKSKKVLGFLSFIESIFFPIPTDALLIPMAISKSYKWFDLALIATLMSVIGGVIGYLIGSYLFADIYPFIVDYGYEDKFNISKSMFLEYGIIILFISSFTPLPYKIFVIAAGFLGVNFALFIFISLIGRGLRFFLVAYVSDRYGMYIVTYLNKYFLYIALITIFVFVILKL